MFWWLAQNTIVASVLALAVALACRLFRLSPAVRHALWLVVLVKLVLPPVVTWQPPLPSFWLALPQSISTEVEGLPAAIATSRGGRREELQSSADNRAAEGAVDGRWTAFPPAPLSPNYSLEMPEADGQPPLDGWQGEIASAQPSLVGEPGASNRSEIESSTPAQHQAALGAARLPANWEAGLKAIWSIAPWIWLAGTAIAAAIQSTRLVRLRRLLAGCEPAPLWLESLVGELSAKLALRPPVVLEAPAGSTPMVFSLLRPTLVWPRSLTDHLPARCRRAVIVHELAHLRRRDHWVGWLELLAGCAWWWNPLFWYVRYQLREAAELACDAWVVATLPQGRRVYAEALIEVSSLVSFAAAPVPAVGMGSSARRTFERRLRMILRERVRCRLSVAGLAAIGLLALVIMPGWTQGQAPPTGTIEPSPSPGDQVDAAEIFVTTASPPDPLLNEREVQTVEFVQAGAQPPAVEANVVFEPVIAAQPGVPGQPSVHVFRRVAVQAAPASSPAQLQNLEARLEQLLAEVRALRAADRPRPTIAKPGVSMAHSYKAHPAVRTLRVTRVAGAGDMQMLSRAKYKLAAGKAEALAAFIKEHVKAEVDTRVDGELLIITAEPHAQSAIAQFIRLIDPEQPAHAGYAPTLLRQPQEVPGTAPPPVAPPAAATPAAPALEQPPGLPEAADPFGVSPGDSPAQEAPAAEPASSVELPPVPATP